MTLIKDNGCNTNHLPHFNCLLTTVAIPSCFPSITNFVSNAVDKVFKDSSTPAAFLFHWSFYLQVFSD